MKLCNNICKLFLSSDNNFFWTLNQERQRRSTRRTTRRQRLCDQDQHAQFRAGAVNSASEEQYPSSIQSRKARSGVKAVVARGII